MKLSTFGKNPLITEDIYLKTLEKLFIVKSVAYTTRAGNLQCKLAQVCPPLFDFKVVFRYIPCMHWVLSKCSGVPNKVY